MVWSPQVWEVRWLVEAEHERDRLATGERVALDRAVRKLATLGPQLPFPHQSSVRQGHRLRELRPRAGRSQWRALYRRIGDVFVIGSVCSEAHVDSPAFARGVASAIKRLEEVTG